MDIDAFIQDLLAHRDIDESDMICVLRLAQELLFEEGTYVNLTLPITICGDIHGQLYDLMSIFEITGQPDTTPYLFLGDYVDRGYYSLESFALLNAYKIKYPASFFMLRGNHEARQTNVLYGFYDEILNRYGHAGLWKLCNETFDMLPMAALISNSLYCVHGGLSPEIRLVEQLTPIERRQEIPQTGPIADLCWSDPGEEIRGWAPNSRGAGWLFGRRAAEEFCQLNGVKLIVRAHQMMNNGYSYHFPSQTCVTVWSAPNYMYRAGNLAAVMKVNESGERDFVTFSAVPMDRRKVPDDCASPYFL
jgi:diadenosine tetraphosphatase ApaH/serine/threonine PP2A family protein phosphatase